MLGCNGAGRAGKKQGRSRPVRFKRSHLEKIVAGHARLAGNTGGDDHQVASTQRLGQPILVEALAKRRRCSYSISPTRGLAMLSGHERSLQYKAHVRAYLRLCLGVDVAHISSNTRSARNIIERQLRHLGVHLRAKMACCKWGADQSPKASDGSAFGARTNLHEHGEGLSNTTSSTQDRNLAARPAGGSTSQAARAHFNIAAFEKAIGTNFYQPWTRMC